MGISLALQVSNQALTHEDSEGGIAVSANCAMSAFSIGELFTGSTVRVVTCTPGLDLSVDRKVTRFTTKVFYNGMFYLQKEWLKIKKKKKKWLC